MAADGEPVSAAEFAAELDRLGPFETHPHLAVAVSGGADSTALAVLAAEWASRRSGTLTALIVDHGLRPESGQEARLAAARMIALGIPSQILVGPGRAGSEAGQLPRNQAGARAMRYDRLGAWCRAHGVLHLLVGHHRRDQAETVLIRLLHGSGVDGLAGMAGCIELADVRVLRPFLRVDPERLRALLRIRGIDWLEDPTNAGTAYERNRLRRHRFELTDAGLSEELLLRLADDASRVRAGCAERLTQLIASGCTLSRFGYASLDPAVLSAGGQDAAAALLRRILTTVGGRPWPPDAKGCVRLAGLLSAGRRGSVGTLGGCLVARTEAGIHIYRERRNLPAPLSILGTSDGLAARAGGELRLWDGRFHIRWTCAAASPDVPLQLRPLGSDGLRQWVERWASSGMDGVPTSALVVLPALFAGQELVHGPFGSGRDDGRGFGVDGFGVAFRPRWSLAGHGYFLSVANSIIM